MKYLLDLAEYVAPAILALAGFVFLLIIWLLSSSRRHQRRLKDSVVNLAHGTKRYPEFESSRNRLDIVAAYLDFLSEESFSNSEEKEKLIENVDRQKTRYLERNIFQLTRISNVVAASVQIFPLLGILGTIMALAQLSLTAEGFETEKIASAFVIALDTTILGIVFAIIFTFIDAAINPTIERVAQESQRYWSILIKLSEKNEPNP